MSLLRPTLTRGSHAELSFRSRALLGWTCFYDALKEIYLLQKRYLSLITVDRHVRPSIEQNQTCIFFKKKNLRLNHWPLYKGSGDYCELLIFVHHRCLGLDDDGYITYKKDLISQRIAQENCPGFTARWYTDFLPSYGR